MRESTFDIYKEVKASTIRADSEIVAEGIPWGTSVIMQPFEDWVNKRPEKERVGEYTLVAKRSTGQKIVFKYSVKIRPVETFVVEPCSLSL